MNRIVAPLILFALGAYGAGKLRDGYQDGQMPALFFGKINPLVFDRVQAPAFFWGVTIANLIVVSGFMLGGILLMAVGFGL